MVFPPPSAFGLPAKFAQWREDQPSAWQVMVDSPARFVGLAMPVGSGKTLAYMTALRLSGGRGVVLTATKGLQDQVKGDGYESLVDVRGMANYPCRLLQNAQGCDEGPCHGGMVCQYHDGGCEYYDRVRLARSSQLVSTNYALWITTAKYSQSLGRTHILVLDEAHKAVDELTDALDVRIPKSWVPTFISLPPDSPLIEVWKDWGGFWSARLMRKLEQLPPAVMHSEVQYRRRVKAAALAMQAVARMEIGNWIPDHRDHAWVWRVIHPARYAEELLFQGADKVILTSATLTQKTLDLLGIPKSDSLIWECPSRFPVERRPIWYLPTVRVDSKMKEDAKKLWAVRIDQIVRARPKVKGIVHTVSYRRRDEALARCEEVERMISHTPDSLAAVVKKYRTSESPLVLVSPSVMTGWDFPHDQCRFQILSKLPFPDTRDRLLMVRAESDEEYIDHLMSQALMQTVGRGMRDASDWCETFLIDDHWKWFVQKNRRMFRSWFLQALRTTLTIPKPLSK